MSRMPLLTSPLISRQCLRTDAPSSFNATRQSISTSCQKAPTQLRKETSKRAIISVKRTRRAALGKRIVKQRLGVFHLVYILYGRFGEVSVWVEHTLSQERFHEEVAIRVPRADSTGTTASTESCVRTDHRGAVTCRGRRE